MSTINWALFLHLYQPSGQQPEVVKNVVETSYRPILSLIERYPAAKVSININACLTEQLKEYGFEDVLHALRKLAARGQIEFVASAKNHSFLPLIPEYEIEWQIKQGIGVNRKILGEQYSPVGFFPTELAVSHKVAKVASRQGFSYILADEISYDGHLTPFSNRQAVWNKIYTVAGVQNLSVFFSNRLLCDRLRGTSSLDPSSFEEYFDQVTKKQPADKPVYVVSANDGEAFGHHYVSRHEILKWAFQKAQAGEINLVRLNDLPMQIQEREEIELLKGSWETTEEHYQNNVPFPLWYHPENPIHELQWQLAWKAIESLNRARKRGEADEDGSFDYAREHLTSGLHSCYFWWASAWPWWNPDMVVKGATELIKVVRTLSSLDGEEKAEAEEYYVKIINLVWRWHWSGEAQARIDRFDAYAKHR